MRIICVFYASRCAATRVSTRPQSFVNSFTVFCQLFHNLLSTRPQFFVNSSTILPPAVPLPLKLPRHSLTLAPLCVASLPSALVCVLSLSRSLARSLALSRPRSLSLSFSLPPSPPLSRPFTLLPQANSTWGNMTMTQGDEDYDEEEEEESAGRSKGRAGDRSSQMDRTYGSIDLMDDTLPSE